MKSMDCTTSPGVGTPWEWEGYVSEAKPSVSRGCLRALCMWFPVTSAAWAAIIYGASRLMR